MNNIGIPTRTDASIFLFKISIYDVGSEKLAVKTASFCDIDHLSICLEYTVHAILSRVFVNGVASLICKAHSQFKFDCFCTFKFGQIKANYPQSKCHLKKVRQSVILLK